MKLKKILALALVSVFTLGISGCSGAANSKEILIGGIGPLTGDLATYGTAAMNGAQLAVDQAKTVLGKNIRFIPLDDKGDQTEAVSNYNKLVNNDKVAGIIGAVTSAPSAAIATASQVDGTPIITPTGTAEDITTYGSNVFRACYLDPFQGMVMANYVTNTMGFQNAAVIYNSSSDYSIGLAEAFKNTFESNGGTVVSYESYAEGDKDFKSQLTKIAGTKPDVLFVPDYYSKVALIAKQVKDTGITATMLGADGWDGVLGVVEDASVINGSFFCNHYAVDDPEPAVQEFVNKYKEKYGAVPNAFAALGYDAANIMIKAIEKAGTTDKAKVVEAMKNTDMVVVTSNAGNLTFDENNNPIKGIAVIKLEDGKHVLAEKINP